MSKFNAAFTLKEKFAIMNVVVKMIDRLEEEVENMSKATSKHEFVTRRVACETRYCVIFETIKSNELDVSFFTEALDAINDDFDEISDEMTALYETKLSE